MSRSGVYPSQGGSRALAAGIKKIDGNDDIPQSVAESLTEVERSDASTRR
jgi:hypothetical protein